MVLNNHCTTKQMARKTPINKKQLSRPTLNSSVCCFVSYSSWSIYSLFEFDFTTIILPSSLHNWFDKLTTVNSNTLWSYFHSNIFQTGGQISAVTSVLSLESMESVKFYMHMLISYRYISAYSLRSEIFRALRIRVGCTHARTTQNHHNAFL